MGSPFSGCFSEAGFHVSYASAGVACPVGWLPVGGVVDEVGVCGDWVCVFDCERVWVVGVCERVVDRLGAVAAEAASLSALSLVGG